MQKLIKIILTITTIILICVFVTMITISRNQPITQILMENQTINELVTKSKEKINNWSYEANLRIKSLEPYTENIKYCVEDLEYCIEEIKDQLENKENNPPEDKIILGGVDKEIDISEYVSSSTKTKIGIIESFDSDGLNYEVEPLDNGKYYYNYKNTYKKAHTEIQLTYPILAGFSHDELSKYRQQLWNGGKFLNYKEYVELCENLLIEQTYNNKNNNYIVLMYPFYFSQWGTQLTDLIYDEESNKITGYIFYRPQTYVASYSNNQVVVIPTDKDFRNIPEIELINMFELNFKNLSYISNFDSLDRDKIYISSCKNDKEISIECAVQKQVEYSYELEFMLKQTNKFNYGREILINGKSETVYFEHRPSGPDS